jgi:hypothetical protein
MRDLELFLKMLAERVYRHHLRDSLDFKEFLLRLSDEAGKTSTVEEFFNRIDKWE